MRYALLALLLVTTPAFGLESPTLDGGAAPVLSLADFAPHPTIGRQRDPGVSYPGDFELDSVTLLVTARERRTGRVFWLDPAYAREGQAALRPFLIPLPFTGVLAGKEAAKAYLRARVRLELTELAGRIVTSTVAGLPAAYRAAGELVAPTIIRDFVRALLRR